MQKSITQLLISIFLFLMASTFASATTYYVRDGGGTSLQCSGIVNAVYPGSGTNQPCAYSNPMFALGAGCGNTGGSGCTRNGVMNPGDTLSIDGDSDITPGNQAQYPIGYDATGVITPSNSGNCTSTGALNCTMGNMPDGSSIIGTGSHKPQLWGREHLNQVINDNNSATTTVINNLEITQHSACVYNGADPNHTTSGFPNRCQTSTAPFGPWAISGISLTGTGITLENNWIHGLGQWGVTTGSLTNLTEENNIINGNGGGGFGIGQNDSGGTINFTGTNTISNEIIAFNGCGEVYPVHSSNPFDTLNYHTCADDSSSNGTILADGWACEASTCALGASDTITMSNVNVSYNTKGGIDNLHMNSSGTFIAYRVRAEGNESQQMKMNEATMYVENSQLINDCNFFQGQSFTTQYDGNGNNPPSLGYDFCRAAGNTIRIALQSNNVAYISNSTLWSDGGANIELPPIATCNSATKVYANNNIIVNTADYTNGSAQNTIFWENDTGVSGCNPINENYNLDYEDHNPGLCAGANDICNNPSNAGVLGNFALNANSNTSYNLTGLATQLYPNSSGPLISAANSSLVLHGTSNDYNNVARQSATYTIGSYTENSTVSNGGTCFVNSECASGACVANMCTGSCTSLGGSCASPSVCCSGFCSSSAQCVAYICGDGIITSPEVCDISGPNLNGQSCATQGFSGGGTLGCNAGCLSYNTSGCSSTVNFPTTSLLDSFTRANSTGLGNNWTLVSGQMNIVSNTAMPINGSNANDKYYWNPTVFGANEEAYMTVANVGTNGDDAKIYARLNPATGNGYKLTAFPNNNNIELFADTSGETTLLNIAQTVNSGDSFGMSLVGSVINVYYKPSGGAWALLAITNDTSITTGGNLEMGSDTGSGATPSIAFTNFGGGGAVIPPPPVVANSRSSLSGQCRLSGKGDF